MATKKSPKRAQPNNAADIQNLAFAAARAADDKKGERVVVLDVGETLGVTDMFVIVSAPNNRLVATIVGAVEEAVKESGGPGPTSIEGLRDASWVLMDYAGFIVHVFLTETREFYDLERLFADAPTLAWQ